MWSKRSDISQVEGPEVSLQTSTFLRRYVLGNQEGHWILQGHSRVHWIELCWSNSVVEGKNFYW